MNTKNIFKNKYAIGIWIKFWNPTEKHNEMHDKMERCIFWEYEKISYRYQLSPNYSEIMMRFQQKY